LRMLPAAHMMQYPSYIMDYYVEIKEIVPMSPEAFRAELESRGWTADMLAKRWGMTKRRVQQLVADVDRGRYYDDAVKALPVVVSK